MRVNVDDKAIADPRFARLGARLKMNKHEALGRCIPVWMFAYQNRSATMAARDVDSLAECRGFADALVAVDLAEKFRRDVRLRGVEERIEFLLKQDEKREKANKARAAKRERSSSERLPAASSRGKVPGQGPYSQDQDQSLAHDPDQDHEARAATAVAAATGAAPSAAAWRPRAGGNADRLARERVARGELSWEDVADCWAELARRGLHTRRDAERRAEDWIERQRPSSNRVEPELDAAAYAGGEW